MSAAIQDVYGKMADVLCQNGLASDPRAAMVALTNVKTYQGAKGAKAGREIGQLLVQSSAVMSALAENGIDINLIGDTRTFCEALQKLIAASPVDMAMLGVNRFAETSPMGPSAPGAEIAQGKDTAGKIPMPEQAVGGKKRATRAKIEVGFDEMLFQRGGTIVLKLDTASVKKARENLGKALEQLGRGRRGLDIGTRQVVAGLFEGLVSGEINGGEKAAGTWGPEVKKIVSTLASNQGEAQSWASELVGMNLAAGLGLDGSQIKIPKGLCSAVQSSAEEMPADGVAAASSPVESIVTARRTFEQLGRLMIENTGVLSELASLKPGLFGKEAYGRLVQRKVTLEDIYRVAYGDPTQMMTMFVEAEREGVLPAIPAEDFEAVMKEGDEELLDLMAQIEAKEEELSLQEMGLAGEEDMDAEDPLSLTLDVLTQYMQDRDRLGGELFQDVKDNIHPVARLHDLYWAALNRDAAFLAEVLNQIKEMPRGQWGEILKAMPDILDLEKQYSPSEAAMKEKGPEVYFERAGLVARRTLNLPRGDLLRALGLLGSGKKNGGGDSNGGTPGAGGNPASGSTTNTGGMNNAAALSETSATYGATTFMSYTTDTFVGPQYLGAGMAANLSYMARPMLRMM